MSGQVLTLLLYSKSTQHFIFYAHPPPHKFSDPHYTWIWSMAPSTAVQCITNFTVYVTACILEKSLSFDNTVETTRTFQHV